jgi:hypothetical protein
VEVAVRRPEGSSRRYVATTGTFDAQTRLVVEHGRIVAERREVKSADYMNLHFMVKRFYDTSVKIIPEAKNIVPEYPK